MSESESMAPVWAKINDLTDRVAALEEDQQFFKDILQTESGTAAARQYARQLHVLVHAGRNGGNKGAKLSPSEVAAAAGVTRPQAYTTIERMAERFDDCDEMTNPVRLRVRHGDDIEYARDKVDRIEEIGVNL